MEKPGLEAAPNPGASGQEVLENVCADCWAEWREATPRIISHYNLVLGNQEHRASLKAAMREFLGLDDEDENE